MGGKHSTKRKISKFFGSSSSSYDDYNLGYPPQTPMHRPYYTPQHPTTRRPPMEYNRRAQTPPPAEYNRRCSNNVVNYQTLDQVTDALARAGLGSSNLIVGIDFTKSNEWTGTHSFNKKGLHHLGRTANPYEQTISIIGKTLSAFDDDNIIKCFGFGDVSTHDTDVFSFYPEGRYCNGFNNVLRRYRKLVPQLRLAGPTSFAPIIEMAMTIVEESGGEYHVLLIIADGQVTRSSETPYGQFSLQEQKTIDAIVKASEYPLSIILVGVGDGPWNKMREFEHHIPAREFNNFQFVNFTEIMSKNVNTMRKETEFSLAALKEIPHHYKATIINNTLGRQTLMAPDRIALPPPIHTPTRSPMHFPSTSFQRHTLHYPVQGEHIETYSYSSSQYHNQECGVCLSNPKDMAFGCGHQTCGECGSILSNCPICRSPILTKIKLYT